jgi:hypothetical protein
VSWGERALTAMSRVDPSELARAHFEEQLKRLDLGKDDIAKQSLDELARSLRDINNLIGNPISLGIFRIGGGSDQSLLVTKTEVTAEIGPLPLLLERRKEIEGRIQQLDAESRVAAIQEEIGEVEDTRKKEELEEDLRAAKAERDRLHAQISDAEQRREEEEAVTRREQSRMEVQARRAEIYQSWLARESMASLIGGILLLAFGVALIVAMFTGTAVANILGNAFLLVLGYFFGQSTT